MKSGLKTKTRVGKICYTNCLPFYHNLVPQVGAGFPPKDGSALVVADKPAPTSDLEFFEAVPTKINCAMHEGAIDLAPISSLEYLNHQDEYLLLPDFVIGARDFSGSVLLISKEKIDGLNGAKVAVSEESLSSAALLKILLKFKYKFENEFVGLAENADPRLEESGAALVIGDKALFYKPLEFVYKYDLSELWWNWTEKPFCFAVWAVRKKFAAEHPEEVAQFCVRLRANLERNSADIEGLMKEALGLTFLDEKFPKIFGYLFNLSFGLDASMREGLELFFRLAHRLEISPPPKKLEFFHPD